VCDDSQEDVEYIREAAIRNGEEKPLKRPNQTVHFDAYGDQGRDRENTKVLVPEGESLGKLINTGDRQKDLEDVRGVMDGIMSGKEMYIRFFCLGPKNSRFSIPCAQVTDSAYVAHSEDILYREGYEEMQRQTAAGKGGRVFKFVHSAGELDPETKVSTNLDKRRIYMDADDSTVYSANTQYAGNTVGLKKLAMRLAIKLGAKEGWLCEHMLVMAVHGPDGRKTYFTGAFPSMCGKTSTAMMDGETIVGDDIAYLMNVDGVLYAVNVEAGMFGIIKDVNSVDDPMIWHALHDPEADRIVSNVLVKDDGDIHWIGKDGDVPARGVNHSGEWSPGKTDAKGKKIPVSHPNARFTLRLRDLPNVDPALDDPNGVPVGAIVYGGRDSDTSVPVEESFDWVHGVITKRAAIESETTMATLGTEGVREFNPMSNLDFLAVPIAEYVRMNLDFGEGAKTPPVIFGVNYFIRDGMENFLNAKQDKRVWYKWMELRAHGEVDATKTPTGFIPKYEDLKRLFMEVLGKDYSREDYDKQFQLRIPERLKQLARVEGIYRKPELVGKTPQVLFDVLEAQRARLIEAQGRHGDYVLPGAFEGDV